MKRNMWTLWPLCWVQRNMEIRKISRSLWLRRIMILLYFETHSVAYSSAAGVIKKLGCIFMSEISVLQIHFFSQVIFMKVDLKALAEDWGLICIFKKLINYHNCSECNSLRKNVKRHFKNVLDVHYYFYFTRISKTCKANINSCGWPLIFESSPIAAMEIGVDGRAPWWSWGSLLELPGCQLVLEYSVVLSRDVHCANGQEMQLSQPPMLHEFSLPSQSFLSLQVAI